MNILVVNDDGYDSPGINVLVDSLQGLGSIYVVAPKTEKSATSRAVTFANPIKVEPFERAGIKQGWRIVGTPTDCVKLAIGKLLPRKPDLVVSGINHGDNAGSDIAYSGTVAAAAEGVAHGVPSIAFSITTHNHEIDMSVVVQTVKYLLSFMRPEAILPGNLLNVNVPAVAPERIKGIRITTQGIKRYHNIMEERKDPRGNSYYWLGGREEAEPQDKDTDVVRLKENYISITPLQLDFTAYDTLDYYREFLKNNPFSL